MLGPVAGEPLEGLEPVEPLPCLPPVELPVRVGLRAPPLPLPLPGSRVTAGRSCWAPCSELGFEPVEPLARERVVLVEELVCEDEGEEDEEALSLLVEEVVVEALVLPSTAVVEELDVVVSASPSGLEAGGTMRGSAPIEPVIGPPRVAAVTPPPARTESASRRSQRRGPSVPKLPRSSLIVLSSIVLAARPRTIAGSAAGPRHLARKAKLRKERISLM